MSSLKKSCDFCVQRKRSCDGLGKRRCSFCVATKQPECHYRPRRSRRSFAPRDDAADTQVPPPVPRNGRSFLLTDDETPPAPSRGSGRSALAGSWSGDDRVLLPFERGWFSASPATGLVGLQENEFLGDFFDCLGFLSLTSEGTVRGAMVRVMLAGASLQHQHRPGAFTPSHSSPGLVGKDSSGVRRTCGGASSTMGGSDWNNALAVGYESAALPRDPATCILWCAIALGALLKGAPFEHVGRYVELAEDALRVCFDGAALNTASAYVVIAFMYNFLGDQVQTHKYTEFTTNIVQSLPPEEIPRGFRDMLQYAGFARVFEKKILSAKDIKDYWENVSPVWQLSEKVMERDICGLVLSVIVQINKPFSDVTVADRVLVAMQQPREVAPVATCLPMENLDLYNAEVDRVCLANVKACDEVQKKPVLHELLRVEEGIESSKMHSGIGGMLYYGSLSYLQLLNRDPGALVSCERILRVFLRYPGLCRYSHGLHTAHVMLSTFAMFQSRHDYEALRASYNLARPVGWLPAPPFDQWGGISDICYRECCRRFTMRVEPLILDFNRDAVARAELEAELLR